MIFCCLLLLLHHCLIPRTTSSRYDRDAQDVTDRLCGCKSGAHPSRHSRAHTQGEHRLERHRIGVVNVRSRSVYPFFVVVAGIVRRLATTIAQQQTPSNRSPVQQWRTCDVALLHPLLSPALLHSMRRRRRRKGRIHRVLGCGIARSIGRG